MGIVEDVLIKVDKFYFPMDFIVLDTEPVENVGVQIPVILGQPFLATANALINDEDLFRQHDDEAGHL
jgi:hypothetical protein